VTSSHATAEKANTVSKTTRDFRVLLNKLATASEKDAGSGWKILKRNNGVRTAIDADCFAALRRALGRIDGTLAA